MTSPSSPQNRRWRRIVVTLAVLAVGLCWWYWPRADQRFVGKWTADGSVFEFHDDGRLDVHTTLREKYEFEPEVVTVQTTHYRWFVSGNRYFQSRDESIKQRASRLWAVLRNQAAMPNVVVDHADGRHIRPSHVVQLNRASE
jgi:hypothetical protein